MFTQRLQTLILTVLLSAFSLLAQADETLDQAAELIKQKNFKPAYELLEPFESERAGEIDYDYLLGVAAIESGQVSRGIFALERVLAQQPNHLSARAMIAKGYFRGGEAENARAEFQNILGQSDDPQLKKLIEDNMSAVDKATGQATTFAAFIDGGWGFDSNINSATEVMQRFTSNLAFALFMPRPSWHACLNVTHPFIFLSTESSLTCRGPSTPQTRRYTAKPANV